jgi:hypothetical protein
MLGPAAKDCPAEARRALTLASVGVFMSLPLARSLRRMTPGDRSRRARFALEPRGADPAPGTIGTLAQGGGVLVGAIVNGFMRTWLADDDGQLTLVMWPGNFHACFDPLEIVDNHNHTVAHGGRPVLLSGGYLKTEDARSLGHQRVFCAWQASQAEKPAATRVRPPLRRRPFRDTRLPTTEHELADLSAAVAQACAQVAWVREAFICRVCREFSDDRSIQTFLAAFVVTDIASDERLPSTRQLLASLPRSMQDAGINVLTDSAVPHSEPLGVQVYERTQRRSV